MAVVSTINTNHLPIPNHIQPKSSFIKLCICENENCRRFYIYAIGEDKIQSKRFCPDCLSDNVLKLGYGLKINKEEE